MLPVVLVVPPLPVVPWVEVVAAPPAPLTLVAPPAPVLVLVDELAVTEAVLLGPAVVTALAVVELAPVNEEPVPEELVD